MTQAPIRALLIAGRAEDAELLRRQLAQLRDAQYELASADRLTTGLERLAQGGIDVVLLDLALPDTHGQDALRQVLQAAPQTPVVVLTISHEEACELHAMDVGAQDYLLKEHVQQDPFILWRVLHGAMERKRREDTFRKSEEQLRTANQRLVELNAMKDGFVATASHELRTPLTAVKEGISLMLDGALGPIRSEQREFLQAVDEKIDRLTELIGNMFDLSKIEAGRMRLSRRRLDVRQVVASTLKSYQSVAGRRTITQELAPVPDVFADPNRLLQVLGNFFSNAVKFTREDGRIAFGVREQDGVVAVSVQDDGIGIAAEDLSKLFQRFSQVGHSQAKGRGTGLGLALCKELVELHGGAISVRSEPGSGSTFAFTLPVYRPALALEESFKELLGTAHPDDHQGVGLLVFDCEALCGQSAKSPSEGRSRFADQVATFMRKHVHSGDIVLHYEPRWVVVLALADAQGLQAMVARLQRVLRDWTVSQGFAGNGHMRCGVALYPEDGEDVQRLFARATTSLTAGAAAATSEPGA
jgi:signal transduction histidine kinase